MVARLRLDDSHENCTWIGDDVCRLIRLRLRSTLDECLLRSRQNSPKSDCISSHFSKSLCCESCADDELGERLTRHSEIYMVKVPFTTAAGSLVW